MNYTQTVNYRQYLSIMAIAFFIYLSQQMATTTIPLFANNLSASAGMIGFITGSFPLMAFIVSPFSGQAVDNENNKIMLIVIVALQIVANVFFIVADNTLLLTLGRGLSGFSWGFGAPVCLTTACNALSKGKMASGIAIYTLGQTVAQVLGPILGVQLMERTSFRTLYIFSTLLMGVAFLLSFTFKSQQVEKRRRHYSVRLTDMFSLPALAPASMSIGTNAIIAGISGFLLLYANEINISNVSVFFTVQALTILACRPMLSKFMKNQVILTVTSFFVMMGGLLVIFFATGFAAFMAAAVMQGIGMAGAQPAIIQLCVEATTPEKRGTATNTNYAMMSAGGSIGSYFSGAIASLLGYRFVFPFMIIPTALLLANFVRCCKTRAPVNPRIEE